MIPPFVASWCFSLAKNLIWLHITDDLFGRHEDDRVGALRRKLDGHYYAIFSMASMFR
jgi:hypothetical protein